MGLRAATLLAGVAGILLALVLPAGAAARPLDGTGMWIWYVSESGGSAAAIAERARRHDVATVLVKSSDGASSWSQFSSALVRGLHNRELNICAWQFVYGNFPVEEARRGAEAVARGADCLVIDAESHYEGRYAAADRYIRKLRSLIGPDYPLALTSFPYVDFHPGFPYSVFLGKRAAQYNVPQMYWRAIGASVRTVYAHTYGWNRPYGRRIFPLGQTYQDPPRKQVLRFRRWAEGYGAPGVSWWSWQETQAREWHWIGRELASALDPPPTAYPLLGVGARGDIVVLLQELLRDAGIAVGIDGGYGSETARAVREFQRRAGVRVTGTTTRATWRALRPYTPVRVPWWERARSARDRRAAGEPAAPASASLPAIRDEIPSTPGRP